MNQISKEALGFLEEAKEAFSKNSNWSTYRDNDEEFIALRSGFREDCIVIYELGDSVGNFVQQLDPQHKVLVDYEDYERLLDIKRREEDNRKKVNN